MPKDDKKKPSHEEARSGTIAAFHDVLKATAVMCMVADHYAMYFDPSAAWLRLLGRFAGPVFFFLQGFSGKHYVSKKLMLYAAVLFALNAVIGLNLAIFDTLCNLILTNLVLRNLSLERFSQGIFVLVLVLMVAFEGALNPFLAYGFQCPQYMIVGRLYAGKHGFASTWLVVVGCVHALSSIARLTPSGPGASTNPVSFYGSTLMTSVLCVLLLHAWVFTHFDRKKPMAWLPAATKPFVTFLSKRSLDIYFGQLVLQRLYLMVMQGQ